MLKNEPRETRSGFFASLFGVCWRQQVLHNSQSRLILFVITASLQFSLNKVQRCGRNPINITADVVLMLRIR